MAIIHNYAIWNNKGGVGKSTITFHIASRYAEMHPEEDVLVIDMCPQANSSMMLLGGGTQGEQNVLNNCTASTPSTVVGYITNVLAGGPGASRPTPQQFITDVHSRNQNMPTNLHLLCGDGNLEIIASQISWYANGQPIMQGHNPWAWVHNIISTFVNDYGSACAEVGKNVSVFIDTNPAFSVYTELAIVAASKLICPVNADDSSRTASTAMSILLHGSNPPHPIYGARTFASLTVQNAVNVPLIHLIVGNRFTQYDGAATAYKAMSDATADQMYLIYQQNPAYFSNPQGAISNVDDFRNEYSVYLRDFNTSGVVAAHTGNLLSQMKSGNYPVYGRDVQLDARRIQDCLDAIDAVIAKL